MTGRRLLGQILKDLGVLHEGQVQEALTIQRDKGGRIGEVLLELGHLQQSDLARGLAEQARHRPDRRVAEQRRGRGGGRGVGRGG